MLIRYACCWCGCSVIKLRLTLSNSMNYRMPGFPVLHYIPEFAQTHVHWVSDAVQPSYSLMPLLLLPSIFPIIRVFSRESALCIRSQSIGASASALVLPMNFKGWFPLGLTGLMSLLSKWLSRVFSSTTIWKHQVFCAQPFLWSNSHSHTWLLEKP